MKKKEGSDSRPPTGPRTTASGPMAARVPPERPYFNKFELASFANSPAISGWDILPVGLVQNIGQVIEDLQLMMKRVRILLADDHTLTLTGMRAALEPHYEIVGTVADGRALVDAALRLLPQVIVMDIGMPLLNGIDAAVQIKKQLPAVKLLWARAFVRSTPSSQLPEAAINLYGQLWVASWFLETSTLPFSSSAPQTFEHQNGLYPLLTAKDSSILADKGEVS